MPEGSFRPVVFKEAIEALRRRLQIGPAEWDALARGFDQSASEAAGQTVDLMLEELIAATIETLVTGGTLRDFQARYAEITDRLGWTSERGAGWHSELVFRMNVATARSAGRWMQAQRIAAANPRIKYYLRYVTAGDHRVRDTHALWHGVILPLDHPFWQTHVPPNGFNCRCHIQLVSEYDLRRFKWALTDAADPLLRIPADEGFETNPGLAVTLERA